MFVPFGNLRDTVLYTDTSNNTKGCRMIRLDQKREHCIVRKTSRIIKCTAKNLSKSEDDILATKHALIKIVFCPYKDHYETQTDNLHLF